MSFEHVTGGHLFTLHNSTPSRHMHFVHLSSCQGSLSTSFWSFFLVMLPCRHMAVLPNVELVSIFFLNVYCYLRLLIIEPIWINFLPFVAENGHTGQHVFGFFKVDSHCMDSAMLLVLWLFERHEVSFLHEINEQYSKPLKHKHFRQPSYHTLP